MVVRDTQAEEHTKVLISRCIADPVILGSSGSTSVLAVLFLLTSRIDGERRIDAQGTARQQILCAGHINKKLHSAECKSGRGERFRRLRYRIAKGLGSEIVTRPNGGVSTTRVADDVATLRPRKDRTDDCAERKMARLNISGI
jgi:hypothetical protein